MKIEDQVSIAKYQAAGTTYSVPSMVFGIRRTEFRARAT